MGLLFSRLLDALSGKTEKRILMLGLDAAGKTTILYKLHLGDNIHTIPTIGFNVETVEYKNISMTMWDIGGQHKLRRLWRYYFTGTHALIFVIDAADRARLHEAKEELHHLLSEDDLRDSVLLVYANKSDLPGAVGAAEMVEELGLQSAAGGRSRPWYVQAASAKTGDGLWEGLDWLSKTLNGGARRVVQYM